MNSHRKIVKKSWVLFGLAVSSLFSGVAKADCQISELSFRWPINGVDGKDWVINNFVDEDPSSGLLDYQGNTGASAHTYDNHHGIDIDLADFRQMDLGSTAVAAADGEVIEVESDLFDRNFEGAAGCGPWNHVYIKHDNGFVTWYGHLMKNHVVVTNGQRVVAGQTLAAIGSSGCSSTAHLHFEVHDCRDAVVDPMKEGMFQQAPQYDTPLQVMDVSIRKGAFPSGSGYSSTDALIKDPPPNALTIPSTSTIGIGLSTAGGVAGDRIDVLIRKPDGSVFNTFPPFILSGSGRHSWPRWWIKLPSAPADGGFWKVEVRVNNAPTNTNTFRIQATNDAVVQGLTNVTYQHTFKSLTDDGYSPFFIDGSTDPIGSKISAIFRRFNGAFSAVHGSDANSYQAAFDQATASGLQLLSISNYISDGQPLIAAVFGKAFATGWRAYHMATADQHQQSFNELTGQGFHPYVISVAAANGRKYISAAYSNTNVGTWLARYGMTPDEYQSELNAQYGEGRAPMYLSAYDDMGTPKFSAIWTQGANGQAWNARHNLDSTQFFQFNEQMAAGGFQASSITSYLNQNGQRLYAGIWTK